MRIAIVGTGSIGRRHARNLIALGGNELHVYDPALGATAELARYGVVIHASLHDLLEASPEAAVICTPPHMHLQAAIVALEAGAHLFIEKPIADELSGIDRLLHEADRRGRIVMVGYNWRFHRALRTARELVDAGRIGAIRIVATTAGHYLPEWRPDSDYRHGYFVRHETGGGIILDGSHEIDQVRWFMGEVSEVSCVAGHVSDLELDVEDVALIALRGVSGALGQISVDCVRRTYTRRSTIVGVEGTIEWDVDTGLRLTDRRGAVVESLSITSEVNAMYLDEMRQFVDHAREGTAPIVDGATGRRILELALAARRSAELGGTPIAV